MSATQTPVPQREATAVEVTVRSVVAPGATLTGSQRRELAQVARNAAAGDQTSLGTPEHELARRFAVDANTIRSGDVAETLEAGIAATTYVEILSLVSRLNAVDTLHFCLGLDPAPLPNPEDGPPTGNIATNATVDQGWVPTVGPATPINALSLLPDDDHAMHELHNAIYLSIEEMAMPDIERGLHRTQIELVAARTSLLNECFF